MTKKNFHHDFTYITLITLSYTLITPKFITLLTPERERVKIKYECAPRHIDAK